MTPDDKYLILILSALIFLAIVVSVTRYDVAELRQDVKCERGPL